MNYEKIPSKVNYLRFFTYFCTAIYDDAPLELQHQDELFICHGRNSANILLIKNQ